MFVNSKCDELHKNYSNDYNKIEKLHTDSLAKLEVYNPLLVWAETGRRELIDVGIFQQGQERNIAGDFVIV
jgi:hypothetical protein